MRLRGGIYTFPLLLTATVISSILLHPPKSPAQQRLASAWKTVCLSAPYQVGDEVFKPQQQAMAVIGYEVSIPEINKRCAK